MQQEDPRRKDVKCFSFDMVVDSDRTNFKDLVESVVEKYPPGYMEGAHIQYYDAALKTFPEINSDHELMYMFSKHRKRRVIIMFITYRGSSDPFVPVTKWDFNDNFRTKNTIELDEGAHFRNPKAHKEHVGVEEEAMYLENNQQMALQVVNYPIDKGNEQANGADSEHSDDSEHGDDSEQDDDEVHEEDEDPCTDGNNDANLECDVQDPPMVVGSTYPNMAAFRLAISQHAIKNQFEFNIAKSGPRRYMVHCSRRVLDTCPWWLYASCRKGTTTVTVITESN